MPFGGSEIKEAEEVSMGLFFLKKEHISQLGLNSGVEHNFLTPELNDDPEKGQENIALLNALNKKEHGSPHLTIDPENPCVLISNAPGWEDKEVGALRIRFIIDKCSEASITGQ